MVGAPSGAPRVTSISPIFPHAEVQQVDDDRQCGFLAAFAVEVKAPPTLPCSAPFPETAGLIEKVRHLRGHPAQARAGGGP
jgi:hypothetical protein